MCGIVGFINANKSAVDQSILEKMNAAITHRGPDQNGFFVKKKRWVSYAPAFHNRHRFREATYP